MKSNPLSAPKPKWLSLGYSLGFLVRKKQLLGLSILLFLATVLLTTAGYELSVSYVDKFAGGFILDPPTAASIWGWIKLQGWKMGKLLFLVITRIAAFYLAFLLAYCLTSPGYVLLSTAAEKLHLRDNFGNDERLSLAGILVDMLESIKVALFGILVTIVALAINFVPGLGQAAVFLLYAFYSALMFIDYPASRRRWSLGRKIGWLRDNAGPALRLGLLPAAVSLIPLFNVFLMSILFPLLTVHSTLNFCEIEQHRR